MWTTIFLIISLGWCTVADGAVALEYGTRGLGDDVTKCYMSSFETELTIDEPFSIPDRCMEAICSNTETGYIIRYATCIPIRQTGSCPIVEDKSKPYPHCCPNPKCD